MKTTPDKVLRVAQLHVKLYETRIKIGRSGQPAARNINVPECEKYLAIWKSIANKGGKDLSITEANEVSDAYYSGEYDFIFNETN